MKRLLLIAAAVLALVGHAHGHESKTYWLNGNEVIVATYSDGVIEVRFRGTEDRNGALIFNGDGKNFQANGFVNGDGRFGHQTGRRRCDYWFNANLYRAPEGLVISANKSWEMAKCRVVLREVPLVHPNPGIVPKDRSEP